MDALPVDAHPRDAPEPLDAHAPADQLGLHLTTVRAHLDVLVDAELVTSHTESRTTPGRPRRLYAAADDPARPRADGYRLLAEMLVSHLAGTSDDVAHDASAAGHTWGPTWWIARRTRRRPPRPRAPRSWS